jgi:transcriptional regulator with XRE-family HTH domain
MNKEKSKNSWHLLGQKIKLIRKVKGFTTKQMVAVTGISSAANYYIYESGRSRFTPEMISGIAKLFGVSVDELMSPENITFKDALNKSKVIVIKDLNKSNIITQWLTNIENFDNDIVNAVITIMEQTTKNYYQNSISRGQISQSKDDFINKLSSIEELLENNVKLADISNDKESKQEVLNIINNFENSLTKILTKVQKTREALE